MHYVRISWLKSLPVVLVLFAIHAYSQSNSAVSEFDPEFGLYLDISRNFRLVFYTGSEKTEQTGSYKGKIGGGASFRMRPVFTLIDDDPDSDKRHRLVIGTFYEFSRSTESAGTTTENRVIVEATPRLHFGHKILLTDRNRTEFRWLGREFRFRYRNRLRLERRFRIGKFRANPYGQAEVYRDFHFDRWSIMKFGVGAEVPVRRWSSFDIFYERQHCVVCESPHANILGLTFNLFLKLKQK